MDISIIIVNYKSKGFTLNCIKSISESSFDCNGKKLQHEIIVVDNNSEDGIGDILSWQNPEVVFIQNYKNIGMGAGNNVGFKKAIGEYVVVMNPDTLAQKNTFVQLYEYMEKNKVVGVVGPKQLNPDKSVQDSCYRWHSIMTPIYRRTPIGKLSFARKSLDKFLMKDFDKSYTKEVDWLLGSFIFMRGETLKKVGYFDERFFLYFEDTDLCKRFWKNDFKVVYNPEVEIIHNHNRDSAKVIWYKFFSSRAARQHIVSWLKYLLKWGVELKIKN